MLQYRCVIWTAPSTRAQLICRCRWLRWLTALSHAKPLPLNSVAIKFSECPMSVCTLKIAAGASVAGVGVQLPLAAGCGVQCCSRICCRWAMQSHNCMGPLWAPLLRAAGCRKPNSDTPRMPGDPGSAASAAATSLPGSQGHRDAVLAGQQSRTICVQLLCLDEPALDACRAVERMHHHKRIRDAAPWQMATPLIDYCVHSAYSMDGKEAVQQSRAALCSCLSVSR